MGLKNAGRRLVTVAAVATALTMAVAPGTALAHARLVDALPAEDASVDEPFGTVLLRFSEPLEEDARFEVRDPSGEPDTATLEHGDVEQLDEPWEMMVQDGAGERVTEEHEQAYPVRVALADLPEEGTYTVDYAVMSQVDGQRNDQEFEFASAGATGPVEETVADETPPPAEPEDAEDPPETDDPAETEDPADDGAPADEDPVDAGDPADAEQVPEEEPTEEPADTDGGISARNAILVASLLLGVLTVTVGGIAYYRAGRPEPPAKQRKRPPARRRRRRRLLRR